MLNGLDLFRVASMRGHPGKKKTVRKPIEIWMHKRTGQIYEHLPTCMSGYALTKIDLEAQPKGVVPDWHDWAEDGIFFFDDDEKYKPGKFENLGEL